MTISSIKGRGIEGLGTEKMTPIEPQAGADQGAQASKPEGDSIKLSQEARLMQRADEVIRNTDDFRADKVVDISQRIQDNSYYVEPRKVADSMISYYLADRM